MACAGSSTAFTKAAARSAASSTWRFTSGGAAATTHQAPSRSAVLERPAIERHAGALELRPNLRRHHRDLRARRQQPLSFARRDRSSADEHDPRGRQLRKAGYMIGMLAATLAASH